ncbi:MAG: hypothetical protein PUB20_00225 [Clostridia bacterium]|nr:hypothetical protein [Clostridia bacterium]
MISNKKWAGLFSACVLIGVIARIFDNNISAFLYRDGNIVGSICEHIVPMIWFLLCGFACAILLFHRNTHTTKSKNQVLNVVYGALSVIFIFAGTIFPFRNTEDKPYVIIVITAVVAAACIIYISSAWFKQDFQKRIITTASGVLLASCATSALACAISLALPARQSYYDLLQIRQTDNMADMKQYPVYLFCFAAASGALILWFNYFAAVMPKIRYASAKFFAATVAINIVIALGLVSTGHFYLSEIIYGMAVSYFSLFAFAKIAERKDKKRK